VPTTSPPQNWIDYVLVGLSNSPPPRIDISSVEQDLAAFIAIMSFDLSGWKAHLDNTLDSIKPCEVMLRTLTVVFFLTGVI
jgi:hypothetical protein